MSAGVQGRAPAAGEPSPGRWVEAMQGYGIGLVGVLSILVLAVPYVAWIRDREQKPVAAYVIFVTVFATVTAVLFGLFATLADWLGMAKALDNPLAATVFLLLVLVPAIVLATWQARKPPSRRGPPD